MNKISPITNKNMDASLYLGGDCTNINPGALRRSDENNHTEANGMTKCNCKNEKIVLNVCDSQSKWPDHVRLTPEAARIVMKLKRLTGLSATQVVSEILVQAENLIEIAEED